MDSNKDEYCGRNYITADTDPCVLHGQVHYIVYNGDFISNLYILN